MRSHIYSALFALLATLVVAQEAPKAKRVWTNDDLRPAQQTSKPEVAKAQQASAAAGTGKSKSIEEVETRVELRTKGLALLRHSLNKNMDELEQATTQEQRHALVAKIKGIERDIEDEAAEVRALEAQVASLKAKPAEPKANASARTAPSAIELDGMRR
jgi:hypothetical protein